MSSKTPLFETPAREQGVGSSLAPEASGVSSSTRIPRWARNKRGSGVGESPSRIPTGVPSSVICPAPTQPSIFYIPPVLQGHLRSQLPPMAPSLAMTLTSPSQATGQHSSVSGPIAVHMLLPFCWCNVPCVSMVFSISSVRQTSACFLVFLTPS